jgi:serine/threonine protein kinase
MGKPYGMYADIWSIGVVFYQILFGKYPFFAHSDIDLIKKIKNTQPDFGSAKISAECKNFLISCLTIDPEQRISWTKIYSHDIFYKKQ